MKTIQLEELKGIQLQITEEVHRFCIENNIRYSLTYGSLIGAVRHNGYIPWDDDIDLLMPRPDYEIFKKTFRNKHIEFVDRETNPHCNVTFGKVIDNRTVIVECSSIKWESGVYVDVFPIDGLGNDYQKAVNHYKKLSLLRHLRDFKMVKLSWSRSLFRNAVLLLGKLFLLPIPFSYLQDLTIKLCRKYEFDKSKYAADLNFGSYQRILPKDTFENFEFHKFENHQFYILCQFDKYLKSIFGDYMKLPPKEKQVTHHVFRAWWK